MLLLAERTLCPPSPEDELLHLLQQVHPSPPSPLPLSPEDELLHLLQQVHPSHLPSQPAHEAWAGRLSEPCCAIG